MKRTLITILLLALSAQLYAADEKAVSDASQDYANKLTINTVNATAANGMYRVKLPLVVYRGVANADLRDVRVFNAKGERVPFALTTEPDRNVEAHALMPLPFFPVSEEGGAAATGAAGTAAGGFSMSVKLQSDGTLVSLNASPGTTAKPASPRKITSYLVDASKLAAKNIAINALNFDWEKNAGAQTGRVNIEASTDLKNWRSVVRDAPLIDMAFNGEALTQKKVEFAATPEKYLRITWAGAAFTLTKLDAESISNNTERVTEMVSINGAAGRNAGEYAFDLGARLPIERVRLTLPDANTLAPTQLFIKTLVSTRKTSGAMENVVMWQPVAGATFYRLTRDGAEIVSPSVAINTSVARGAKEWLAKIDARGGGMGSSLPKLEVTWQPQQLVFTARGEAPFTLAFGRADAKAANFAISDLMPGYEARAEFQLPLVDLQVASEATVVTPGAQTNDDTNWKKISLWAVLIGGVGLMAWMAMRLGRTSG